MERWNGLALTNVPGMGRECGVGRCLLRTGLILREGIRGENLEKKAYKIGASHGSGESHATAVY